VIATCAMVLMLAGSALANSLPPGTQTFTFSDGSTMTGNFIFNTGNNTLTSWAFQYSGGPFSGAETFNSADTTNSAGAAAPSSLLVSNFNGDEVISIEENQPDGTRQEFDIAVACGGVANCLTQAAVGSSFAIVSGPTPCPPVGTAGFCIVSGLQRVPEGFGQAGLAGGGFLNVTDPNGTLAFNINDTATGTLFNGGGGTGTTVTPEPGTLPLLTLGLAALAGFAFWKKSSLASFAN
jgi:hypothetical protein